MSVYKAIGQHRKDTTMAQNIKNVNGQWRLIHGNGFHADVNIQQAGGELTGSASRGKNDGNISINNGTGIGNVNDSVFSFVINWDDGLKWNYQGTFGLDGFLTGITFDQDRRESQATWVSGKTFFNLIFSPPH
jgi:hypothetical protein